jgi:hypothetical protein
VPRVEARDRLRRCCWLSTPPPSPTTDFHSSVQTRPLRRAKNQMAATTSTATMATIHVKPVQSPTRPEAVPAPGPVPPPAPLPVACAKADEAVRRVKPASVVSSEWRIIEAPGATCAVTSTPMGAQPVGERQPQRLERFSPLVLSAQACPSRHRKEHLKPCPLGLKLSNG